MEAQRTYSNDSGQRFQMSPAGESGGKKAKPPSAGPALRGLPIRGDEHPFSWPQVAFCSTLGCSWSQIATFHRICYGWGGPWFGRRSLKFQSNSSIFPEVLALARCLQKILVSWNERDTRNWHFPTLGTDCWELERLRRELRPSSVIGFIGIGRGLIDLGA